MQATAANPSTSPQPGALHSDGTRALDFIFDDGGRAAAGFAGRARDCVARSIAIASKRPYAEVYAAIAKGNGSQRASLGRKRSRSARNGVNTGRKWFKDYMQSLGFHWIPAMHVGSGRRTRLLQGELPSGRIIVALTRHYAAVIDGVIHDTANPSRTTVRCENGDARLTHRSVYGFWVASADTTQT